MEEKRGIQKSIQSCCIAIVLIVCGYLLLANIYHMVSIRARSMIAFSGNENGILEQSKKGYEELIQKNIQLQPITKTTNFNETEVQAIKDYLKIAESKMETSDYWKFEELLTSDVQLYLYLMSARNMIPDIHEASALIRAVDGKVYNGKDLKTELSNQNLSNASFGGYALNKLKDNDRYFIYDRNDFASSNLVTFIQYYINDMIQKKIELANLLLDDGGVS